jgi:hypothetical protein
MNLFKKKNNITPYRSKLNRDFEQRKCCFSLGSLQKEIDNNLISAAEQETHRPRHHVFVGPFQMLDQAPLK